MVDQFDVPPPEPRQVPFTETQPPETAMPLAKVDVAVVEVAVKIEAWT